MPIDLVAQHPAVAAPRLRSAMMFVAQLAAIVVIACAVVMLGSLPSATLAGSAQDTVAAP